MDEEPKTIESKTREIQVKNLAHKQELEKWPAVTYANGILTDTKLTFSVNEVKGKGWRLPHDGKKARSLFEIESERAITTSIYEIITGSSKEEVREKGEKLGLDFTDIDLQMARLK